MIVEVHPPDARARSDDCEHRVDQRRRNHRITGAEDEVIGSESDHPAVSVSPGGSNMSGGEHTAVGGTDGVRNSATGLCVDDVREAGSTEFSAEVPTSIVGERVPDHCHAATAGRGQRSDADLFTAGRGRRGPSGRQESERGCRFGPRRHGRSGERTERYEPEHESRCDQQLGHVGWSSPHVGDPIRSALRRRPIVAAVGE